MRLKSFARSLTQRMQANARVSHREGRPAGPSTVRSVLIDTVCDGMQDEHEHCIDCQLGKPGTRNKAVRQCCGTKRSRAGQSSERRGLFICVCCVRAQAGRARAEPTGVARLSPDTGKVQKETNPHCRFLIDAAPSGADRMQAAAPILLAACGKRSTSHSGQIVAS